MKNLALFIALVGAAALANEIYLLAVFALAVVTLIFYFGFPDTSWDLSEFYNRLPTVWQDIPETIEIAMAAEFFVGGVDISSTAQLYGILDDNKKDFEIKVDERLMDAFEDKYDTYVFLHHPVSPRVRALFHYFTTIEGHPEDIERFADIAQAVMVRKRLGGTPKRTIKEFFSLLRPVLN